jgi:VPDSG-CTERM motif
MKLFTIGFAGAFLAVASFCPVVMAQSGTLNLDQVSPYNYDVGGEFTAFITSGTPLGQNYSPLASTGGGFDTFCVEVAIDFNPGNSFNYTVNSTQSADGHTLTEGAAYLYTLFATGALPNYNYANPSATDAKLGFADAGELQAALWWFQGNQSYNDGAYPVGTNNYYYQLALSNLGLNSATAETPNNGQFAVDVLVLTDGQGNPAQNQLVYVPDSGTTLMMFAVGLLGLFAFAYTANKPKLQPCPVKPIHSRRHSS